MMNKGDDIKMRGRRNEKWRKTRGEGSVNGILQGGGVWKYVRKDEKNVKQLYWVKTVVWKGGGIKYKYLSIRGGKMGGRGGDQNNKSKSKHETVIQRVGTGGTGVVMKRK